MRRDPFNIADVVVAIAPKRILEGFRVWQIDEFLAGSDRLCEGLDSLDCPQHLLQDLLLLIETVWRGQGGSECEIKLVARISVETEHVSSLLCADICEVRRQWLHFDHGGEVSSDCSIEARDKIDVLIEQIAYDPAVVGDRDRSRSDISKVISLVINLSFTLLGPTYRDSWLLSSSGASTAAASGRVYDCLPVVANAGMRLNLSNAVVFALLTVLTSVTVIVMPARGM